MKNLKLLFVRLEEIMVNIEINKKCLNCEGTIENDGEDIEGNTLYVKGYCYECKTYYDLEYKLDFTLVNFVKDVS